MNIVEKGASIGEGTHLGYFTHVLSGADIGVSCTIGDNVTIGHDVIIGDNVKIGHGVSFAGNETRSQLRKWRTNKSIVEDNVKIGSNVTILGNTIIRRGAIVADGTIVITDIQSNTFVAGNPARIIYSLSSLPI